ncbi:MAG TPA: GntR family transcriptional regulator [Stellaceae bacterium]|nr:GntR family transcriptional regulator [Stellaceae bacterium]
MATKPSVKVREEAHDVVDAAVSAVDHVMEAIKSGIRHARYVPGQRLVEPDMMRDFDVSRGTVREALRRLAAEGFVQVELYRGASIRKMSRGEFVELNEIRALLEGYAASLAAQRMSKAERKKLLDLEQQWDRAARDLTYAQYNERFHALIVEASRHKQLPNFVQQAQLAIFRLQFHRILQTPVATRRSRLEHRRIVKAVLKGDSDAAESAMRQHIQNSAVVIMDAPDEFFSA